MVFKIWMVFFLGILVSAQPATQAPQAPKTIRVIDSTRTYNIPGMTVLTGGSVSCADGILAPDRELHGSERNYSFRNGKYLRPAVDPSCTDEEIKNMANGCNIQAYNPPPSNGMVQREPSRGTCKLRGVCPYPVFESQYRANCEIEVYPKDAIDQFVKFYFDKIEKTLSEQYAKITQDSQFKEYIRMEAQRAVEAAAARK